MAACTVELVIYNINLDHTFGVNLMILVTDNIDETHPDSVMSLKLVVCAWRIY